jgi:hypothetical protein
MNFPSNFINGMFQVFLSCFHKKESGLLVEKHLAERHLVGTAMTKSSYQVSFVYCNDQMSFAQMFFSQKIGYRQRQAVN